MNVLFLDFDGPLFPYNKNDNQPPKPKELDIHPFIHYWQMDESAVSLLNELRLTHPFKTIISSSWNRLCSVDSMKKLFEVNGLNLDLHDDPIARKRVVYHDWSRADHIKFWLTNNFVKDYIILDDMDSGTGFDFQFQGGESVDLISGLRNVFIINPVYGIDKKTAEGMRKIVRNWND